jgi:Flp pilus assembly pilin Flp
MRFWLEKLSKSERVGVVLEYGLIAAGIAVAVTIVVQAMGSSVTTVN